MACVAFVRRPGEARASHVLAEVDPVSGAKRHSRLLHAATNALVVAEVADLETKHSRLDPGSNRSVQCRQPLAKRDLPLGRFVFTDGQSHRARAKDKDIMNDNLWRRLAEIDIAPLERHHLATTNTLCDTEAGWIRRRRMEPSERHATAPRSGIYPVFLIPAAKPLAVTANARRSSGASSD